MENQNLTIESFFIDEYKKIQEENKKLKEELYELKETQCSIEQPVTADGFTDLKTSIKLIYVDTNISSYYLFKNDSPLHNKTVKELQELIIKSDEEIVEYLTKLNATSYSKALSIREKTFPFTLKFTTYKGTQTFAYDPDYDDDSLIKLIDDKANTNCWVVSKFKDECIRYAVEKFIEEVNDRIEELEKAENVE